MPNWNSIGMPITTPIAKQSPMTRVQNRAAASRGTHRLGMIPQEEAIRPAQVADPEIEGAVRRVVLLE